MRVKPDVIISASIHMVGALAFFGSFILIGNYRSGALSGKGVADVCLITASVFIWLIGLRLGRRRERTLPLMTLALADMTIGRILDLVVIDGGQASVFFYISEFLMTHAALLAFAVNSPLGDTRFFRRGWRLHAACLSGAALITSMLSPSAYSHRLALLIVLALHVLMFFRMIDEISRLSRMSNAKERKMSAISSLVVFFSITLASAGLGTVAEFVALALLVSSFAAYFFASKRI